MFHESGGEEEFEDTFGWSAEGEERYFAEPTLSSIVTTKPSRMGERAVGGQAVAVVKYKSYAIDIEHNRWAHSMYGIHCTSIWLHTHSHAHTHLRRHRY